MDLLKFQPLLKRIRWGGRRLGTLLHKPIGEADDYAESWEISDHGDDQSRVVGGPLDGWTLERLVRERNRELFGRHAGKSQFPLLVKFLDAHDRLSVQVHPNDEQAKTFDPSENGKTEAWVILAAEPGSRIYAGLQTGVDRERLAGAVENGTVEECLHSIAVHPGDCVFIPAGTVHAIGEGIVLAEIQQASDLTFRLYDWGRLGTDGKPRPLHINAALSCTEFERGPVDPVSPRILEDGPHRLEELIRCDFFVLHRHITTESLTIPHDDRFHVLMLLDGAAEFRSETSPMSLDRGGTVLMPAACGDVTIQPTEQLTLLEAFLP